MLVGKAAVGATTLAAAADTKYVSVFDVADVGLAPKLEVFADTLAAPGHVRVRAVAYDALSGLLLGEGDEVVVPQATPAGWLTLPFVFANPGGVPLPSGQVELGVHVGDAGLVLRHDGAEGSGGMHNSDSYSDGASASFGAATADTFLLSAYTDTLVPSAPEAVASTAFQMVLGRLPFSESQRAFAATGPERGTMSATVSWHGSKVNRERGAFATAARGGKFEQYAGRRLEVTAGGGTRRTVRVYVNDIQDVLGDLSLTRQMFAQLAPLGLDSVPAQVKVLKEG